MSTVFALGNSNSWSVRGYVNPILSHFCLFSEILCLFLQFSALESCYICLVTSLEYPSAYFYSFCPRKIQNRGLSGGIRGYVNLILSYFCLFSEIFYLFLQFSTLELCFIWLLTSLKYPSAYVYSCCPGKIQNRGLSGGIRGYVNLILSQFCLFFQILCLFLKFSTLESCYIQFTISLEYSTAYVNSFFPGKIQNRGLSGGIRGYVNLILSQFCLFFEILCLFLQFSTLESCYIWFTITLEYSSAYVYSCCPGKIQNQVCQGVSGGTKALF